MYISNKKDITACFPLRGEYFSNFGYFLKLNWHILIKITNFWGMKIRGGKYYLIIFHKGSLKDSMKILYKLVTDKF